MLVCDWAFPYWTISPTLYTSSYTLMNIYIYIGLVGACACSQDERLLLLTMQYIYMHVLSLKQLVFMKYCSRGTSS